MIIIINFFIYYYYYYYYRELNRCPNEKLSSKAAKEMYEHSVKIEAEYKDFINGMFELFFLSNFVIKAFLGEGKGRKVRG